MRNVVTWLVVAMLLSLAPDTLAYAPITSFARSANDGGGNKVYYTGSQRFRGYHCGMCHIDAAGKIGMDVSSNPPGLFTDGSYKPFEEYTITMTMTGEHRGLESDVNDNMFVADFVDDTGKPAGDYAEIELATLQRSEGKVNIDGVVVGASNLSTWSFTYIAPAPGAGRLSFHVAVVDGDAGLNQVEPRPPTDPFGDDVWVGQWRLCEEFTTCELGFDAPTIEGEDSPVAHGCSLAPGRSAPSGEAIWWLSLLAVAAATRRRPR